MRPHDADDHGVKLIHEFSRGGLVALADALQAASKIKGRGIRHKAMELAAYTIEKTLAKQSGYSGNTVGRARPGSEGPIPGFLPGPGVVLT